MYKAKKFPHLRLFFFSSLVMALAAASSVSKAAGQDPILLAYNSNVGKIASKSNKDDQSSAGMFKVVAPAEQGGDYVAKVLSSMLKKVDLSVERDDVVNQLHYATYAQKHIYAVYLLQTQVKFGGFNGYFSSHAANLIPEAKLGLKKIGATRYLYLLRQALRVFADDEHVLDDTFMRKSFLEDMSADAKFAAFEELDAEFESLENESMLQDKINAYINKNPKHFFAKKK